MKTLMLFYVFTVLMNELTSTKILEYIKKGVDGKKTLSDGQEEAVMSESKHIRVLAGAGAGKTETLTRRILYLLLYKNVPPEEIVAFTFTEKAAQSMKSRIYTQITQIMGEEYAAKIGKMYIGTIHSYALRILQDYFGFGNYDVLDDKQEMAFVMRRGYEIGVNTLNGRNYAEKCKKFVDAVNVVYDELIPRNKLKEKNPEFYDVLEKYEQALDDYHRLTFGRLIYLAVSKIKENPEKLPTISHLIVDEYQDINHAQEELIKLVSKNGSIMIVGDPRQTIYQWRGSDDGCFERFATELYPDTEPIPIPENRRSGKHIVEIGNAVADKFENKKFEHMTPIRNENGHAYVMLAETPEEEAYWIAGQIEKLVNEKGLKYSDFGILLRSVRTSGDPFIRAFKEKEIPYLVGGTIGLFRREEATAVGKLFAWLYNGGFFKDYKGNTVEYDELVDSAISDWISATGLLTHKDLDDIKKDLDEWKSDVLSGKFHNFQEVYHSLLNILDFRKLDPNNKKQKVRSKMHATIMANLGRFSNLLGDYENAVRLGGNKISWSNTNLSGLMWYINLYATTAYEEQLSEDIRGIDAVQITTIHQAKGLEWHVVFIPALVHRRFPSSHVDEEKRWLISRDLFPAERYDLKMDDERRLFYVAVTRAKSTLIISAFQRIRKRVSPSVFLEEILYDHPKILEAISPKTGVIEVEFEGGGGGEEEIYTYDAGEIVDYTKCPYFYRMRYIWNYDAPLAEELGYGNALHYCLRRAVELRKGGFNPYSAIVHAVNNDFHLPYAPFYKAEIMKKGAEKMLLKYVKDHLDDIEAVAEVEYRLEFPQKKSTITGKVDVIIDRGENVEVREYKTSKKVATLPRVSLQVQLYALGLIGLGHNVGKGSVAYLQEGDIHSIDVSDDALKKAKEYAGKILDNIHKQKYDPTPGEFCENCDYRDICKWYQAKKGVKKVE